MTSTAETINISTFNFFGRKRFINQLCNTFLFLSGRMMGFEPTIPRSTISCFEPAKLHPPKILHLLLCNDVPESDNYDKAISGCAICYSCDYDPYDEQREAVCLSPCISYIILPVLIVLRYFCIFRSKNRLSNLGVFLQCSRNFSTKSDRISNRRIFYFSIF